MKVFRICVALCLSVAFAAVVVAQGPQGQRQEEFSIQGQIQAIAPNQMKVQSNVNQTWMIAIPPNARVSLMGTAKPDFLQPGMFIRFDAEFDKRGAAKEKIEKVAIFTPTAEMICGAWPKGSVAAEAFSKDDGAPGKGKGGFGRGDGAGKADAFGKGEPAAPAETPKKGKPAKAAQESGPLTVAGQITGVAKGAITVNTGDANYKIELAEDAAITIKVHDYSLARPGDTVSAKGKAMPGVLMGQASEVKITGAEPFTSGTATKGKPTGKPKHDPVKKDPPPKKDAPPKKEPSTRKDPAGKKGAGKSGAFDDVINGFE